MGSAAQKCCNAPIAMLLCNIVCIKSGQLSYSVIRNFRQRHLLPTLSKRMVSSPPRRPSKTNETHRTSSRGGFCCFKPSQKLPGPQNAKCRFNPVETAFFTKALAGVIVPAWRRSLLVVWRHSPPGSIFSRAWRAQSGIWAAVRRTCP